MAAPHNAAKDKALHNHLLYRGLAGQRLSRLLLLGLYALIIWVPLPMGSNRPWALALMELAVALLLAGWLCGYLSGRLLLPRMRPMHWLLLCLWCLWLGWLYLQCLALPMTWLASLSPYTYELYAASIQANSSLSLPATVSLLPDATYRHLYESMAYAGLFWLVFLLCGVRNRLRGLLWAILISGLMQAVFGSLMSLTGLEYGFLQIKEYYRGSVTGTFINRNHFAGYMELCLAAAFGLLIATKASHYGSGWKNHVIRALDSLMSPALLVRITIIILFAALVLSRSRMGNIAFLSSLLLCAAFYLLMNWKRDWWRVLLLMLGFAIIDIWWVGGWFGGEELLARFQGMEFESELRAKMLPDLMRMIWLWPMTGAGMGSFHVLYPHFQGIEVTGFNLHAHNDYAQFLIELGIPGTALLLGIAVLSCLRAVVIIVRRQERVVLGVAFSALLGGVAIAVHGVADFNLQIPANAATLVVLLAAVWCCKADSSRRRQKTTE